MHTVTARLAMFASIVVGWGLASSMAVAQVNTSVSLDDLAGTTGLIDPGGPKTTYRLKVLIVNNAAEFALLQYTQQTDNGPVLTRLGWIYLSNDRQINYKMSMLTLLRDALDNPARQVWIGIVPGTENTSRRIVSSVAIGPNPD